MASYSKFGNAGLLITVQSCVEAIVYHHFDKLFLVHIVVIYCSTDGSLVAVTFLAFDTPAEPDGSRSPYNGLGTHPIGVSGLAPDWGRLTIRPELGAARLQALTEYKYCLVITSGSSVSSNNNKGTNR